MLLSRSYPERLLDCAISRAKNIPRKVALKKAYSKKTSKRPAFVTKYDPRLPSIGNIQAKHWRSMVQDQYLAECFPEPPLTAFKRQRNIRDILIRAKVPPPPDLRQKRELKGMAKCTFNCSACPYVIQGRNVKINKRSTWTINRRLNCNTFNAIYMIECEKEKCKLRYIGESKRSIKYRFADHRGYVVNKHVDKATGAHFNLPGHSLSHMKFTILEQVKINNDNYRKERERYFIQKFDTYNQGLNRQR